MEAIARLPPFFRNKNAPKVPKSGTLRVGNQLVKKQHEKAAAILMENREKLEELAKFLYEEETITGKEFMRILDS